MYLSGLKHLPICEAELEWFYTRPQMFLETWASEKSKIQDARGRQQCRGYNGSTLVGILPVSAFANGHTYYSQDLPKVLDIEPYVVHNTFQWSHTRGKRHRFRERLLWLAVSLLLLSSSLAQY